ncbi:MAG: phytoene/squalene synthase family protein [Gemmatimonadetes bacterium]|nr:phytoene/squalene synthase family protein [Gemmatimonadota bacterium]
MHQRRVSVERPGRGIKGDRAYCSDMLPKVSRTFALCIRLLPSDLEHPVLLAYLLCRIADTIEDSADLSAEQKSEALEHFGECVATGDPDASHITELFESARTDEEELAREADAVLREFGRLPSSQQMAIRQWVKEMCTGMAGFAARYRDGDPQNPRALASMHDLDRYCYYVAGTVGHLLTDLFATVRIDITPRHYAALKPLANSFGLGLQLTNIIKDVADDRQRGWSFVPEELYRQAGIVPGQLHDPAHAEPARQVMATLIAKARRHLDDALEYCVRLPRTECRVRMFCLTSLYFAVRTLNIAAREGRLLHPEHKVKITRGEVYRTVGMTAAIAPINTLVRRYFKLLAGE